jgi:hypothetical protein
MPKDNNYAGGYQDCQSRDRQKKDEKESMIAFANAVANPRTMTAVNIDRCKNNREDEHAVACRI